MLLSQRSDELYARIKNILELRKLRQEQARKISVKIDTNENINIQNYRLKDIDFLNKFRQTIEQNYMNSDFSRDDMCQIMNISISAFSRKINALLDCTPHQYLRLYRLEKAAQLLKEGYDKSLSLLAESVGFTSQQHFSSSFRDDFGVLPKDYLK